MHHAYIDRFAQGDSPVHRLDARAKLLAVLAYSVLLISFGRYELSGLAGMTVLPLALLWAGGVPTWFALRRVAVLSPFILMLCLASPLYDRLPQPAGLGPWRWQVAGGWLTAGNVAAKFALGVLALTALTATTPFASLLEAMRRLGAPRAVVMQMGLLYRYIFLLIDQAMRVRRARDFRGSARAPAWRSLSAGGGIVAALFVRTLDRADGVQLAMSVRGWTGQPHGLRRLSFRAADAAFLATVAAYLAAARWAYPAAFGG